MPRVAFRGMGHLAPLLASLWTQQATWMSHSGQAWVPRPLATDHDSSPLTTAPNIQQ